jgi:hypothetical protein
MAISVDAHLITIPSLNRSIYFSKSPEDKYLDDFVGYIAAIKGTDDIDLGMRKVPGQDGAIAYDSTKNARGMTYTIVIIADTRQERAEAVARLDYLEEGLRSDLYDLWTDATGAEKVQRLRYSNRGEIEYNGTMWQVDITFVCPDPYVYSQHLNEMPSSADSPSRAPSGSIIKVPNAGTRPAYPTVRCYGPFTNMELAGDYGSLQLDFDVPDGQYVDVISGNGSDRNAVLLNGVTPLLGYVPGQAYRFPVLAPMGVTNITFTANGTGANTGAIVQWRHTWAN